MAVQKQKLKKNIEGFIDHQGIFRPIRNGEKEGGKNYLPELAGYNDDVFDAEIRKMKNQEKAEQIYQKRMMDAALESALGDEKKVTLSQFVRRSGGIFYDKKYSDPYNGELENLSFKQSRVKGLAHAKGKYSLDGMREAADLAGYGTSNGDPLVSINDFLDALDSDLKGNSIYPFGNIGAYKFNPGGRINKTEYLRRQIKNLDRVIRKLKTRKASKTKIAKLENVRELAAKLARNQKPTQQILKKNGLLTAFAELAVGTSAAVGLFDRFTEKKEVKPKKSNRDYVGLKENKAKVSERQKAIYERSFQKLLVAIENGDLSKESDAKKLGKLAGNEANDVSRAVQYARLTYKLKQNPSLGILKQAETLISKANNQLKQNGIVGRALGRYKAGREYKRQLRLEAAIDRAKKRRAAAEAKAKKNPTYSAKERVKAAKHSNWTVKAIKEFLELKGGNFDTYKNSHFHKVAKTSNNFKITKVNDEKVKVTLLKNNPNLWKPIQYKGVWIIREGNGLFTVRQSQKGKIIWRGKLGQSAQAAKDFVNSTAIAAKHELQQKEVRKAKRRNPVSSKSYEAFQGRKPTKVLELAKPDDCPRHLYALGKLLELRLKGKQNLNFRRETTGKDFYICADERNKQLWIVGGKVAEPNNSIKSGYSEPYALITHIVYETKKVHLDDKKEQGYIHKFGEEGGEEPTLAFDREGFPIIVGGTYEITPLGIAD